MLKKKYSKTVCLASGGEEGFGWSLFLLICEKSKLFAGNFIISGILQKQRSVVRSTDREFFKARLGEKFIADKVLHHLWIENSSKYTKVVLLHKSEHPNGGMNILRERDLWIQKEKWLLKRKEK